MRPFAVCAVGVWLAVLGSAPAQGPACFDGFALHYDGTDDFVVVPDDASLNFSHTEAFTVEAWIRTTNVPPPGPPWTVPNPIPTILEKWNGQCAVPHPYHLRLHVGGAIKGGVYDGIACAGSGTTFSPMGQVSDNQWHHVAYQRDLTGVSTLWVDGALEATSLQPPFANTGNNIPLYLGRRGPGGPFNNFFVGDIDEVRISKVARYTVPFRPTTYHQSDADTVLLLHFDEGSGATAGDASGLGNDGLLGGSLGTGPADPAWVPSTLPGPPMGFGSSVNGGTFDSSLKTFWTGDTVSFGTIPGCLGNFAGALASVTVNFGPEALVSGVTPNPSFGLPAIAGFNALNAFSAPQGAGFLLGDGLGLGPLGWGPSLPLGALTIGSTLSVPIPGGLTQGLDLRMQALFLLPDTPSLSLYPTNEIFLRAQM